MYLLSRRLHVVLAIAGSWTMVSVLPSCPRTNPFAFLAVAAWESSVALRILMGFLKPQVGSHQRGRRRDQRLERRGNAGDSQARDHGLFRTGALFDSLSVRENVAFPLREHGGLDEDQIQQIVDRLIKMVGAEDVAEAYPASLSTGRNAQWPLPVLWAAQPEVVLYDEPTTMVDRSLPGAWRP